MTPAARLDGAIALLAEVIATARPADAVVSAWLRNRRYIGAQDRRALAARVYGVLRRRARLGWWIAHTGGGPIAAAPDGLPGPDAARPLVLADLVLVGDRTPAAVAALCTGGRYAPAPLSEPERRMLERLAGRPLVPPEMPAAVRLECPPWAEAPLRASLGDRFAAELEALTAEAPVDLRVNRLKADRAQVLAALDHAGIDAAATPWSPLGVRLADRAAVTPLAVFRDGWVELQDEGSQLLALVVDARPGHQLIDFCAGAGGKTLAIAATMANRGRVIACDVLAGRLTRAAERLRRAGVHNVETRTLSSARDPWVKRHKRGFDRVLVDAPCTGIGAWRRNPDARWRPLGPGLAALVALQAEILDSAARLVRPGGRLIYATCSLLAEENADQVARFLACHPAFRRRDAVADLAAHAGIALPATGPDLHLSPARHGTDGFFASVLARDGGTDRPDGAEDG